MNTEDTKALRDFHAKYPEPILRTVEQVFVRRSVVIVRLACGHEKPPVYPYPTTLSAEQYAAQCQEWIGHTWRCDVCN